jgi:hypothetical protein
VDGRTYHFTHELACLLAIQVRYHIVFRIDNFHFLGLYPVPHIIFQQHPMFLRQPKVQSLVPRDAFFHTNLLELNNRSLLVFGLPFLHPSKQMISIIPYLCTADIGFPRQIFISCSLFPCSIFKWENLNFLTHKSFVGRDQYVIRFFYATFSCS